MLDNKEQGANETYTAFQKRLERSFASMKQKEKTKVVNWVCGACYEK